MSEKSKYFVVKQKAVPEVLLKVVEAKRLLDSSKAMTVQEATEKVGISRSSFYKYKDDIFPFHDNSKMCIRDRRIIERGTHEQLIEQKGRYYQLYTCLLYTSSGFSCRP